MRKGFFITVLIVLALAQGAHALTYYVDKNSRGGACNDSNPGTQSQPWCTIAKANAILEPGDTVYIRGGAYKETIKPVKSGAEGNPITYVSYAGEDPVISNATYGVHLVDKKYIVVDGITIDGWVAGYPVNQPSVKHWVLIDRGDHNIIKNCTMQYSWGWYGFRAEDSHYNKILNNKMHSCGSYEERSWSVEDNGDTFMLNPGTDGVGCNYNLVQGNDIGRAGHGSFAVRGQHNVIRENYIHNEWEKSAGTIQYGGVPTRRNLFEDNIIAFSNNSNDAGNMATPGWQLNGRYFIIRRNKIHSNAGSGMFIAVWNRCLEVIGFKIYNNVVYRNGYHDMPNLKDYLNDGIFFSRQSDPNEYDFVIEDNSVLNNIIYDNYAESIDGHPDVLAMQEIENNLESDPFFVDATGYDFRLQSHSPAIDAGRPLTTTTSSGSGTIISVKDARYFYDGWGIPGEQGDLIQLEGQTQTARITSIDYDNNRITVDRSLTWSAGLGVSLPYKGSAPDIGAYEYGAAILYGDVSENGSISAYDASLTAQHAVGVTTLTSAQQTKADVSGEGTVSAFDASWIARKVVDESVVFPVEE